MSEQAFDRENYDRSEQCANCGATVHFVEGVPSVPRCYLCGDAGGEKVTAVIPAPEKKACADCGSYVYGFGGHSHYADCPQIAAVRRRAQYERDQAKARHPSSRVRIPARLLGDRIWDDVQERYTSRGEELA